MKEKIKISLLIIALLISLGVLWVVIDGLDNIEPIIEEDNEALEQKDSQVDVEDSVDITPDTETVIDSLNVPWEMVFLPNGEEMLITERPGSVVYVDMSTGEKQNIANLDLAEHVGEGGLLGMALHPGFSDNSWIYLYMTSLDEQSDGLINRVERFVWTDDKELIADETIISGIPGARFHDGGRIAFGPEGYLYITTGDAGIKELSQDINSLAGKILRINDDGSIPEDNPFDNAVYSYGHRNPQGIAWDNSLRMWATEHGSSARDELNMIDMGQNYGWPDSVGDVVQEGTVSPVIHSGMGDTWAPSGIVAMDDRLFFVGLRGSAIYEARLDDGDIVDIKEYFKDEFGRIRNIVMGPDNMFYIATNNTDGRGTLRDGDDKVIRINPRVFFDGS